MRDLQKHFRYGPFIAASLVLLSAIGCAHGQINGAQGPYALIVSNSEKDLETTLGKYFEEKKGWKVQYLVANNNPEDIYLGLIFKMGEGVPDLKLRIDTFVSNEKKGLVQERRVLVETFRKMGIKPGDPHYQDMLNWINAHSEKYWVPDQMFLDRDGDLALKSSQNIVGRDYNLHAEQVSDMVIRLAMAWEDIDKHLPAYAKAAATRPASEQKESVPASDTTTTSPDAATGETPDAAPAEAE